jgi:hypothetical protein
MAGRVPRVLVSVPYAGRRERVSGRAVRADDRPPAAGSAIENISEEQTPRGTRSVIRTTASLSCRLPRKLLPKGDETTRGQSDLE